MFQEETPVSKKASVPCVARWRTKRAVASSNRKNPVFLPESPGSQRGTIGLGFFSAFFISLLQWAPDRYFCQTQYSLKFNTVQSEATQSSIQTKLTNPCWQKKRQTVAAAKKQKREKTKRFFSRFMCSRVSRTRSRA